MEKILITGGAGFIGSYCVEKFKNEGYSVTVLDNFSTTGQNDNDKIFEDINLIKGDILDYKWDDLEDYDLILHMASPVGPAGVLKHSGNMARYIIDDVYWAIEGALKNDCPLLFMSTSEIYGFRDSAVRLSEDEEKILVGDYKVRNEYSVSKLLSEIVLSNTSKVSNLKYQIIRPFNISGARQQVVGGFVLPTFVTQSLKDEDITVFGDGEQIRAFTHVKDIVDGIYLISQYEDGNEIWNIGNPNNECTIKELADMVKQKIDTASEIKLVDPKTIHGPLYEEAWDKVPEPSKIKKMLNWKPKYDIDYIVDDVIEYFKNK
jgi:nucleoside-diphosphate-sugar epimerase|tara:strand:- start:4473 stop:5429 length:957 start_codon:yes stop_codon:yes gene_type:complete